jgi:predicted transcriptional regulator of viral defense system
MIVSKFEKLMSIIKYKGVVTAEEARNQGISTALLKQWIDKGKLDRISRGIYSLPNDSVDSLFVMQLRCGKGIYSHETALMLHDLSDRVPSKNVMTVPKGYNTHRLNGEMIEFHWVDKNIHELGLIKMTSMYGNEIKVYDLERTICDIIKYRSSMDLAIVNGALKAYIEHPNAKLFKLSLYAKKMGIAHKVNEIMEVLQ